MSKSHSGHPNLASCKLRSRKEKGRGGSAVALKEREGVRSQLVNEMVRKLEEPGSFSFVKILPAECEGAK